MRHATLIGAVRSFSTQIRAVWSEQPERVRLAVEVALALLLVVQLGRLVWIVAEPRDAAASMAASPVVVSPADPGVFQRFDAFFRAGGQGRSAEGGAGGGGQMRLYGLRSDGAGGGSAIIGLADGRQVSVGVGEEVEPGLVLRGVGPDHVTLARGASVSRLAFPDTPMEAVPVSSPNPAPQASLLTRPSPPTPDPTMDTAVDPARLMTQAGLRPRMRGLRIDGFTVSASGDAALLRAAGLQAGDVILAVNGQPLDSLERIAALRGQLENSSGAELRYERDGTVQTSTIGTGR